MQALYDKMCELVASPTLAFFTSNKQDFTVHDRRSIVDWGTPQAEWLWIVRPLGTSLTRLKVCPLEREWAEASMSQGYATQKFFHLTVDGPREIQRSQALALIAKPFTYELSGSDLWSVSADPQHVAAATVKTDPDSTPGDRTYIVSFATKRAASADEISVMRLAGIRLAAKSAQSLFTRVSQVLVNGVPIEEAFRQARQRERLGCNDGLQTAASRRPLVQRWGGIACAT